MQDQLSYDPPFTIELVASLLEAYNQPDPSLTLPLADIHLVKSNLLPEESENELNIKFAVDRILVDTVDQIKVAEQKDILKKRYIIDGGMNKRTYSKEISKSPQTVSRREFEATVALTQLLNHKEFELRETHQIELKHYLGSATYKTLIGDQDFWKSILSSIINPAGKWVTVVTGIGGIGKSSQTHRALWEAIDRSAVERFMRIDAKNKKLEFIEFLTQVADWLKVDASEFERADELAIHLLKMLKISPYLIYIDGVEEHIEELLDQLIGFANPSQILITSRVEPTDKSKIHFFQVPLLSQEHAKCLVLDAKSDVNANGSADLSDAHMSQIYEKVGGNPLALKLVGALLGDHSLSEVFEDLIDVNYPDTEKMYRRVYIKTWNSLHPKNQDVLTAFGVVKDVRSISIETLLSLTVPRIVKDKRELYDVLNFLKTHSLVEIDREDTSEKTHYKIHNLTRTFLETDIIDWGQ